MPEENKKTTKDRITPSTVLDGESPLVLTAALKPVADQDRFQPAGFPEVGHVIYKAPRGNGAIENVCIVDSAASMANHLESVCMRGAHDYDLVDDLNGMPYLRCVTDPEPAGEGSERRDRKDVVVTSLTEGHRIASTYFLGGKRLQSGKPVETQFDDELADKFGIALKGGKRAHPPAEAWWQVFKAIFRYDPNALVHGVLFPQWQIKIPRVLTAHLEAFGAARVDRSGVKFDRLQKTTSKQPIFAVDDATAREIRATFVLDIALLRSFGREKEGAPLGLADLQKRFLVALALWKIRQLLAAPFRFRSGCHLQCVCLKKGNSEVEIDANMNDEIGNAAFRSGADTSSLVTDIFWPREELYSEVEEDTSVTIGAEEDEGDGDEAAEKEGE